MGAAAMQLTRRDLFKGAASAGALASLAAGEPDPAHGFKLGIITDEISTNLDEAVDFIDSYHLHFCELREIWGKNLMISPQEDLDRAKKLLDAHHLTVSDIGSPVFKWNIPGETTKPNEKHDFALGRYTEEDSDKTLLKSFELARFFGTKKVRIFSYWRVPDPEKVYPQVRDRLAKAAQLAAKNDILLVLENEYECNVGTGKELGRILRDIDSPALRGVWDPGNAVMLGETPFPDGYEAVKGLFPHMHIKDARKNPATGKIVWAPVGGGFIDFKGQFAALHQDKYSGTMSLETHYRRPDGNKMESTRESLEGLLKVV
jgi:sugar phosphate isomerase/epimerase